MEPNIKRNKAIFIGVVVLFFAAAIAAVFLYIDSLKYDSTLDVLVAPSFATVTIDEKEHKSKGVYQLETGTHKVKISADGFTTKELEITTDGQRTTKLYTYLVPSNGSMDWYTNHPSEDMLLTTIGGENASQAADEFAAKYPISRILPIVVVEVDKTTYDWTEYRVDGGHYDECEKEYCIKITDTTGGNRENALQKVREKGFDPEEYEILYEYTPIQPLE